MKFSTRTTAHWVRLQATCFFFTSENTRKKYRHRTFQCHRPTKCISERFMTPQFPPKKHTSQNNTRFVYKTGAKCRHKMLCKNTTKCHYTQARTLFLLGKSNNVQICFVYLFLSSFDARCSTSIRTYLATTSFPDRPLNAWSMNSPPEYDSVGARSKIARNLVWACVSDGPVTCIGKNKNKCGVGWVQILDRGRHEKRGQKASDC